MKRVGILFSGRGSNLKAIIEQANPHTVIACAITDNPAAGGIQIAHESGVPTTILPRYDPNWFNDWEKNITYVLASYGVSLVVLAGFMRVLHDRFCETWANRCINIHPSLLPKYPGLNTHQRAIEAGDTTTGCTVHYVVPKVDAGPIIAQHTVSIEQGDTAEDLAVRVLAAEHQLYPAVVNAICDSRICYDWKLDHRLFKNQPLTKCLSIGELL
jgi:phosphoribosylglycinamide formyltransferase-1